MSYRISPDLMEGVNNPALYLENKLISLFRTNVDGTMCPSVHEAHSRGLLWQDSAGTVPSVIGQPVGMITDWSGKGKHFTQATAGKRPILQADAGGILKLVFDAVDDNLSCPSINWGRQGTVVMGLTPSDLTTLSKMVFNVNGVATAGRLVLSSPGGTVNRIVAGYSAGTSLLAPDIAAVAGMNVVSSFRYNADTPLITVRRNGTLRGSNANNPGTNSISGAAYIGSQNNNTNYFNGSVYGFFAIARELEQHELSWVESYINIYAKGVE